MPFKRMLLKPNAIRCTNRCGVVGRKGVQNENFIADRLKRGQTPTNISGFVKGDDDA
jgi:hypothetical protein